MLPKTALAALAAALVLTPASVSAQDEAGRYTMTEVDNGILRLDTQTGDVSHCRVVDEQWVCRTAADDRAALDDEIAELQAENEALRDRVAELEGIGERDETQGLHLPTDEDLDQVIGFMERLMRRFYAFAESLRNESGEEEDT